MTPHDVERQARSTARVLEQEAVHSAAAHAQATPAPEHNRASATSLQLAAAASWLHYHACDNWFQGFRVMVAQLFCNSVQCTRFFRVFLTEINDSRVLTANRVHIHG